MFCSSYQALQLTTAQVPRALFARVCCQIPFIIVQDFVLLTHILFSRCWVVVHVGITTVGASIQLYQLSYI